MIKVHQVSKKIKDKSIIEDISFQLNKSDVLGVVGPNGTGKSTLLYLLCDIEKPATGHIDYSIDNKKYRGNVKDFIGYVPQSIALYNELSLVDNLMLFGAPAFNDIKETRARVHEIIDELHLTEQKSLRVSKLSGGQKRRVNIAASLLKNPEFIIMDEPVVGVDYYARKDIEKIIHRLRAEDKIVIIVSHQIEFLENVCNKLLILKEGKQVCFGDFNENKHKI